MNALFSSTMNIHEYTKCTRVPLVEKDHIYTAGCSMGPFSNANTPLYKDHLSTETTNTWSLEWSIYVRM